MPTIKIADKSTLDKVYNNANTFGSFKSKTLYNEYIKIYGNTNPIQFNVIEVYNLIAGHEIICDKSKVKVYQNNASLTTTNDGYKVSQTGTVYITSDRSDNLIYVIR